MHGVTHFAARLEDAGPEGRARSVNVLNTRDEAMPWT